MVFYVVCSMYWRVLMILNWRGKDCRANKFGWVSVISESKTTRLFVVSKAYGPEVSSPGNVKGGGVIGVSSFLYKQSFCSFVIDYFDTFMIHSLGKSMLCRRMTRERQPRQCYVPLKGAVESGKETSPAWSGGCLNFVALISSLSSTPISKSLLNAVVPGILVYND